MAFETCEIPDNSDSGLDIILPDELKDEIISETEFDLAKCFVESLDIQWWSDVVTELLRQVLIVLWSQWRYKNIELNQELLENAVEWVLGMLKNADPRKYIDLHRNNVSAYVDVNGVRIDFSSALSLEGISLWLVRELHEEWFISKDEAFTILEWSDWFQEDKNLIIDNNSWRERWYNLSDALVEFWFSENFLSSMREVTWRDMNEQDQERLLLMSRFFLQIESRGWYNITHDTWASSAEGYLQYVHKNWRLSVQRGEENEVVSYEWLTNSFETWLRKLPDSLLARHEWLRIAESDSWVYLRMQEGESIELFEQRILRNQNNQSPLSLSAEEQLLLTFNDLYSRWSTQEYFLDIFEANDNFSVEQAIIDLYVQEHHAGINTPAWLDDATKRVITRTAIDLFWYWEWTVLFSPVPKSRPDRSQNTITPVARPDNFDEIVNSAQSN